VLVIAVENAESHGADRPQGVDHQPGHRIDLRDQIYI